MKFSIIKNQNNITETMTGGLFMKYVNTFLKIKQESLRFSTNVVTDKDKDNYIQEYLKREGVELEKKKIEFNPGKQVLNKLMLNSM